MNAGEWVPVHFSIAPIFDIVLPYNLHASKGEKLSFWKTYQTIRGGVVTPPAKSPNLHGWKSLERHLCAVYGKNKLNDINDVRM